jgi:hypothetical protein
VALLFYFMTYFIILAYSHNTHQVLVGLPQEVGGLAMLFYIILVYLLYHAPGARRPPPWYFILFYITRRWPPVGGLGILFYFILFHFISFCLVL